MFMDSLFIGCPFLKSHINGNCLMKIFLSEVLEQMRKQDETGRAILFSISFRTYNSNTKKGGRLIELKGAKLVMQESINEIDEIDSLRYKTKKVLVRKNPKHYENKTRNIKTANGDIKKINIRDIISFNGKTVSY